ncbi:replication initiator protein [Peromfec virus RodF7_13]|uniref:Replication initiator protein n=1 Tax=Peromfec virus RodF7_13 TaxID=2929348 RepID=A0A976R8B6_9VIRU|nr:replication initiator protein [Peromfec virus RodF7_13]
MIRTEWYNGKVFITSWEGQTTENLQKYLQEAKNHQVKREDVIPCGKCIGCRLEYSRQWANRIILEAKEWEENWFVTLTYADEYLPLKQTVNTETGEIYTGMSLEPDDLQKFLKRLRKYYETKEKHTGIRYFAAGEYGEKLMRPHYHICIFNMPIKKEQLKKYKNNEQGDALWTWQECAEKIWKKGYVVVGRLNWETAAYTARYIMKKQKGKDAEWFYKSMAKYPEFTRMSLKPGIGQRYYEKNKEEIYKNDEIYIPKKNGGMKIKPPKAYDKKYKEEEPEKYDKIRQKRIEQKARAEKVKLKNSTNTLQEMLKIQEREKEEKTMKLIRSIE